MKRRYVIADPEKCTGCGICELICSAEKEKEFNPLHSRIHLVRIGSKIATSIACLLCEDPACVKSCPRDALKVSEETGIILVDEEKCDGCSWCIEACGFGAITLDLNKKVAIVCDLCEMKPKCVESCPPQALSLSGPEHVAQKTRRKATKKLVDYQK